MTVDEAMKNAVRSGNFVMTHPRRAVLCLGTLAAEVERLREELLVAESYILQLESGDAYRKLDDEAEDLRAEVDRLQEINAGWEKKVDRLQNQRDRCHEVMEQITCLSLEIALEVIEEERTDDSERNTLCPEIGDQDRGAGAVF